MNPTDQGSDNQGEVKSDWVSAPADSHVDGFQLIDRSASEYGANSKIIVRFKGRKGPPATYEYSSTKHFAMKATFDALCGSANPGEVVHSELIAKKIPFIRLS